jgi:tetraacyldisaccharide 4'-kinase
MSRRSLWPLLPLVPVYGIAQALDSLSYVRGWRRVERLRWPVVSVGNLSVGGAGKTPLVIALARLLTAHGWQVDVLSRGYGRASHAVEQVHAELQSDGAARFGDEPWLIAQAAGVPVFVGADRVAAGRLAEQRPGVGRGLHLLDDGMQHRRLARDVEIVVLHASDFQTTLLPAGRLREPLAALQRADFVVLREEDAALAERARRWMGAGAALWKVRRELELPALPGAAVVFSAIAHPDDFIGSLRSRGVEIAASRAWRDHHRFLDEDVEQLCRLASQQRAACFITTEKDEVRLSRAQRIMLERTAPLLVARLSVHFMEPEAALDALASLLRRRAGSALAL